MNSSISDRAAAILRDHPSGLTSDVLSKQLFGAAGGVWHTLLMRELAGEPFVYREDTWRVEEPEVETADIFAVHIETTGQDASKNGLVALSACRIVEGRADAVFHTFVNPERRLPGWLADRLGVEEDLGDHAPGAGEALHDFAEFVGNAPLVGLDISAKLAFLQYKLKELGIPVLKNPTIELLPAIQKESGEGRKPTLERAASRLGVPVGKRYRGANEVRLIAAVWLGANEEKPAARTDVAAPLDAIARAILDSPGTPGVYVFRDGEDVAIYVGKAKRLKQRLLSYVGRPAEHNRRLLGLRKETARVEILATVNDLDAHLLELTLLDRLSPRYNVAKKQNAGNRYLRLSQTEAYPKIVRSAAAGDFGPFDSVSRAGATAKMATEIFRLRTCSRKLDGAKRKPRPPCALLEADRCLGPCVPGASRDAYRRQVARAAAFLGGERKTAIDELQRRSKDALAAGDGQRAGELFALLRSVANQDSSDVLSAPYDPAEVAFLLNSDDSGKLYVIRRRKLVVEEPLENVSSGLLKERLGSDPDPEGRRGTLAARWLNQNKHLATLIPFAAEHDDDFVTRFILDRVERRSPWV